MFYAFDLVGLDGKDLRKQRCDDRRARLHELIGDPRPDSAIQFSQAFEGSGGELFTAVERMGLEGIVSKRKASIYRGGPSKDWIKIKAHITREYVVIGYEHQARRRPVPVAGRYGRW